MSRVFKQQTNRATVGIRLVDTPEQVCHNAQLPSIYEINGQSYISSCVGCLSPMCMRFMPEELGLSDERLTEFPVDVDDSVCPLNALIWERGNPTPTIVTDRCINCGICARRCPLGAIYSSGVSAVIHTGEAEVNFRSATPENIEVHNRQMTELLGCRHTGQYLKIDEDSVDVLYSKLAEQQTEAQFPNLIVRNLFLVLGNRCIIRRRGDVYFRIDAIIEDNPVIGVTEIEFRKDTLEPPRSILDDIAVLSSRYGIAKQHVKPFIVFLELPNLRTEYWRVIKDIKDVLDIKVHTMTLGALCTLTWGFSNAPISLADFYADINAPSIKQGIEVLCAGIQSPDITRHAVFEPMK